MKLYLHQREILALLKHEKDLRLYISLNAGKQIMNVNRIPAKVHRTPYQQGFHEAGFPKNTIKVNPFKQRTEDYKKWEKGFMDKRYGKGNA